MAIWFTSDIHFGHQNIIRYCKRPYQSITDMDAGIIENWNSKVNHGDTVYFLGDFMFHSSKEAMLSTLSQLNGDIFFIRGNHDHRNVVDIIKKAPNVIDVRDLYDLRVEDEDAQHGTQHIVLCHYPLLTWNRCHYGAWHLHGHCVDYDTEVLTDSGWKDRSSILAEDLAISYNHETKSLEHNDINRIIDIPNYSGKVYSYDGKDLNFRITADHTCVRFSRDGGLMYEDNAAEFCDRSRTTVMRSHFIEKDGLPLSSAYLKLYILIIANGSVKYETNLVRIRVSKCYKKDYILNVLQELDLEYKIYEDDAVDVVSYKFTLPDKLSCYDLRSLDAKILNCNPVQFKYILEAYENSHGCKNGNGYLIYSEKEAEIDILQALSVQSGFSATKMDRIDSGPFSSEMQYRVSIYPNTFVEYVKIKDNADISLANSEPFWCISVKNKNFFMRRNGKVHLTGNCHGSLKDDPDVSRMDVGVDTNNMHLYSYDDIKKCMQDTIPPSLDHHVAGSR